MGRAANDEMRNCARHNISVMSTSNVYRSSVILALLNATLKWIKKKKWISRLISKLHTEKHAKLTRIRCCQLLSVYNVKIDFDIFKKVSFFVVGHAAVMVRLPCTFDTPARRQKKHKLSSWQVTARLWMRGRDATEPSRKTSNNNVEKNKHFICAHHRFSRSSSWDSSIVSMSPYSMYSKVKAQIVMTLAVRKARLILLFHTAQHLFTLLAIFGRYLLCSSSVVSRIEKRRSWLDTNHHRSMLWRALLSGSSISGSSS